MVSYTVALFALPRMPANLAFSPSIYKSHNHDLSSLNDEELYSHFITFGINEGRIATEVYSRKDFVSIIEKETKILEIGPFASPLLPNNPKCDYFDVLPKSGLAERAKEHGLSSALIPNIKWVSEFGDLTIVEKKSYPAIVSSHVIEHQVCLIRHLRDAFSILTDGGTYYLFIPDKRFIYDHSLPETRISEVIDAYHRNDPVHSLTAVIDDAYLTIHNDTKRHWEGDHCAPPKDISIISAAIQKFQEGKYIDVHNWRFTPGSLLEIINNLTRLKLLPDYIDVNIYNTIRGANEFFVTIRKLPNE